jgi:hypothetical protein
MTLHPSEPADIRGTWELETKDYEMAGPFAFAWGEFVEGKVIPLPWIGSHGSLRPTSMWDGCGRRRRRRTSGAQGPFPTSGATLPACGGE